MSSRPIIAPYQVVGGTTGTSGDMSGNITSTVTIIQNTSQIGYDISWSGSSPVGAITVQVSNSYTQNVDGSVKTAGNWTTVTLSAATNVSGNTGNGFIDIDATGAYAIRLIYTRTSGTGTLTVFVAGKVA